MVEGGAALGMGIYRGFTGLVTKPVEGAKSKGVGGKYTSDSAGPVVTHEMLGGCKDTTCCCCMPSMI